MTTRTNRRSGDARQGIIDAILSARVSSRALRNKRDVRAFLAQYFADVPYEDLEGRSEKIMARVALDHLEFGARRRRGQALLRIFNVNENEHGYTSAYTFIEMVNDDLSLIHI